MDFKNKILWALKGIETISLKQLEIIKVSLLAVIAICAIIIAAQVSSDETQDVYVVDGRIDANANVKGTVSIDKTVDINIHEINGYRNVFFNNPGRGEKDKYYLIPVTSE